MKLYLVQHGEAVPKAEDPARPLTKRGRDDVARVAALARQAGVEVRQVRHSGKRRAEETARILAKYLEPKEGVVAFGGLAPRDHVHPVAELLHREAGPLLFVGHLPFMDRLLSLLVTGSTERPVVRFQLGSLVCLEHDPDSETWLVRWFVIPALLP